MKPITTKEQLITFLTASQIKTSAWGRNGTKTIEDLLSEVLTGEVHLEENPTSRALYIVNVIIRSERGILVETEQTLADGKTRSRKNYPPSGKMKVGESVMQAAARCLEDSLGLTEARYELIESSRRETRDPTSSPSYPGLTTLYHRFIIEAKVTGLPKTDFWSDEAAHNDHNPVRKHHWAWRAEEAVK